MYSTKRRTTNVLTMVENYRCEFSSPVLQQSSLQYKTKVILNSVQIV